VAEDSVVQAVVAVLASYGGDGGLKGDGDDSGGLDGEERERV